MPAIREFVFDIGEEVTDSLTGFTGVVMGRTQYAAGNNTYGLCERALDAYGAPKAWQWFDEIRLSSTGGPRLELSYRSSAHDEGASAADGLDVPPLVAAMCAAADSSNRALMKKLTDPF